jgi:hypothetical protein
MFELLSSSGVVAAALIAPPGPEVCAALLTVHPGLLQPAEEVDVLIAWERQTAWLASITATVMARVGDLAEAAAEDFMTRRDSADMALRAAYAEIGAALRLSDVTAGRRLETARVLVRRLPAVHAALAAGDITYWHAFAVADATSPLDEPKVPRSPPVSLAGPATKPSPSFAAAYAAPSSPPTRPPPTVTTSDRCANRITGSKPKPAGENDATPTPARPSGPACSATTTSSNPSTFAPTPTSTG